MIDPENAFDVDLDASFFSALAKGSLNEILIEIDGAAWYPPASVTSLVYGYELAVALLLLVRISYDYQAELVRLEDSP